MFDWLRYKRRLYGLNRREKKLNATGERLFEEGQEANDPVLLDNWLDEGAQRKYEDISWERKKLVTRSLLKEADELHLPRPDYSEGGAWQKDIRDEADATFGYVLTPQAMLEVRSTIRKEKRERREELESLIKISGGILTILTGFVGTLIGLVAVLRHK